MKLVLKKTQYNQQTIDFLKTYLASAEKGEIQEMCCTVKLANGEYEHCWSGSEDLHTLVGILERQKHLMLRRMDT
jgi:hypothetical protein